MSLPKPTQLLAPLPALTCGGCTVQQGPFQAPKSDVYGIPRSHPSYPPEDISLTIALLLFHFSFSIESFPLSHIKCFFKKQTNKTPLHLIFSLSYHPFHQSPVYSNFLARVRCTNKLSILIASCSLYYSVLNPVQSGLCSYRSNETTLAKVKDVLHFARYNGELSVPIVLDLLIDAAFTPLFFFERLPAYRTTVLLSFASSASPCQSIDCSSSMHCLRVHQITVFFTLIIPLGECI